MASNYNNAAWFYDKLSQVVFGNTLIQAQCWLLNRIPPGSTILIAGGGTGKILEEIARIHPAGLKIAYTELSHRMINRARKRNIPHHQVEFINADVRHLSNQRRFDVIITPFLLDSINPAYFEAVFGHLYQLLKPGGLWLNTDFQLTGKWWQKPLLKSMYYFFRLMGCTDAVQLPPVKQTFATSRMSLLITKTFYSDFIAAEAYQKK